ncbi:MAG: AAA family ATPase [Daejeonella sp.]
METKKLFKLLKRYLWLIILLPVLTVGVTYLLVKDLPEEYKSQAQLSTGLADQSQQMTSEQNMDYFRINQQFSSIIEMMKMKKMIDILSYHLILHDLKSPQNAFVRLSDEVKSLSPSEKEEAIAFFTTKLYEKSSITAEDNGKIKFFDILTSMGYDEKSIRKKLEVTRNENSDFISVNYVSTDPLLSAFAVNTLSNQFINTYEQTVDINQAKSIALLDSLLKDKEQSMNTKNSELKDYKMENGVLNLGTQSDILYAQISAYEERKAQAIREIQSNQGAIASINSKLNSSSDNYAGGTVVKDNNDIINLRSQLQIANERYVDENFSPVYKRKIDSLQNLLSTQVSRTSDRYLNNPQVAKENLLEQKRSMDVSLDLARNSIRSIDRELAQLKGKYNSLVPFDAGIQGYERDADVATKEYLEVLERFNQGNIEKSVGLRLQIVQLGLPGLPLTSKRLLYTSLSGVSILFLLLTVLLLIYLFDRSINNSKQLATATQSPVLGSLTLVKQPGMDLQKIWNNSDESTFTVYKDLLRSLRFEIDHQLSADENVVGITSMKSGEGKTFLSIGLAYAFAMTDKKVLLISSDFEKPKIDKKELPAQFFENFLVKREIEREDYITVLNTKSNNGSLLEVQNEKTLKAGFEALKNQFDIIIIDINSMGNSNKAKEWLLFTDKNVAVFEAGKTLSEEDKDFVAFMKNQKGFMGWVLNKVKVGELNNNTPLLSPKYA